jgi:hypothetical protein
VLTGACFGDYAGFAEFVAKGLWPGISFFVLVDGVIRMYRLLPMFIKADGI